MFGKRLFLIFALILFVSVSAFSSLAYRPHADLFSGGAFCIPTAQYLREYPGDPSVKTPPVRTSFSYGVDVDILGLTFCQDDHAFGFGAGVSYLDVSRSVSYGLSTLKSYRGFGAIGQVCYRYRDSLGVSLSYRYLDCTFVGVSQHFLVQEFEVSPTYRIGSFGYADFSLRTPVCISVKADSVTVRFGIGLSIGADSLKAGGGK